MAFEEREAKNKYLTVNNVHNLTKVARTKSEQGIFSNYPHFYELKFEGKSQVSTYGMRNGENSEFLISSQEVTNVFSF